MLSVAALGIGYLVSLLFSGHYVHKIRWKPLILFIFCVWLLGVFGSGYSKQYNSFYVLLFSRIVTGCREAAFQVVAPPLIQDRGGMYTGLWLSVYLAGLPVGLASGYVYGSFIACSDRWGWDWAYYFLFIVSLPQLLVLMFVKDESNGGILAGVEQPVAHDCDGDGLTVHEPLLCASPAEDDNERVNLRKFSVFSEFKACISCPVLVTLSLGWAAILGACASISTFGVSFVVALELFDNENVAASWFGTLAAVAGILGTILGGRLADKVLKQYRGREGDARRGDGVDDAFRHPIIASMLPRISMLVVMSMIFVFPTVVVHNAVVFLVLLFIGWVLLCK